MRILSNLRRKGTAFSWFLQILCQVESTKMQYFTKKMLFICVCVKKAVLLRANLCAYVYMHAENMNSYGHPFAEKRTDIWCA